MFNVQQRIVLLGYGVEGQASAAWLRQSGYQRPIEVLSDQPNAEEFPEVVWLTAEACRHDPPDCIIRSPGFSPHHPLRQMLDQLPCQQTTATNIALAAFRQADITVIGITASKGKSTTSTLLHLFLQAAGVASSLVGNIGTPVLSQLSMIVQQRPVVVMELSSYQCADIVDAPPVVYLGSLFPEHIDYHGDIAHYYAAKLQLAAAQRASDLLVIHAASVAYLAEIGGARGRQLIVNQRQADAPQKSDENLVPNSFIDVTHLPRNSVGNAEGNSVGNADEYSNQKSDEHSAQNFYFDNGWFVQGNRPLFNDQRMRLVGRHNRENACAAMAMAHLFGAQATHFEQVLAEFNGLPFRLQNEGCQQGRIWINDSISTAPEATAAAIAAFSGQIHTLIAGGQDRGYDVAPMIAAIIQYGVQVVIVLPETGAKISEASAPYRDKFQLYMQQTVEEAVERAIATTPEQAWCLFSPGAPSYHAYRDFIARGLAFRQALTQQPPAQPTANTSTELTD